jgi:hypothetical protein
MSVGFRPGEVVVSTFMHTKGEFLKIKEKLYEDLYEVECNSYNFKKVHKSSIVNYSTCFLEKIKDKNIKCRK